MSNKDIKNLDLVYIASPYAHENHLVMQLRYEIINNLCGKIIHEFECGIFSPISHGHNINTYLDKDFDRREYWMSLDLKVLKKCSHMFVLMLDGWKESLGVQEEIKFCMFNDIEVHYIEPGKLIGKEEIENIERALINSETNLNVIQYVVGEWGQETFHNCTSKTILAHMQDEIGELIEVDELQPRNISEVTFKQSESGKEAADVGMLLLHYCHKRDINLGKEIINKFRVNQKRTWSKEKNDKVFYSHLEDDTSPQ